MKPSDLVPQGSSRIKSISLDRLENLHICFRRVDPATEPKRPKNGIQRFCNSLKDNTNLEYLDITNSMILKGCPVC